MQANAQQKDTIKTKQPSDATLEKDDSVYRGHISMTARDSLDEKMRKNYRRATLYSTFLPGLGQVYNKKYWKVPLVYAAIGIPGYLFFYNKSWYKKSQYALTVTINQSPPDSVAKVEPIFLPAVESGNTAALINIRNEYRKDQDYAALFFVLFYALNIVDATVDAHLKDFNVTSDLSFRLKPFILPGATPIAGITLAFDVHKPRFRSMGTN